MLGHFPVGGKVIRAAGLNCIVGVKPGYVRTSLHSGTISCYVVQVTNAGVVRIQHASGAVN